MATRFARSPHFLLRVLVPPVLAMDTVRQLLAPIDAFNAVVATPLEFMSSPDGFLTLDKAKYLLCILLCYVLSLVYRLLPNKVTLKVRAVCITILSFGSLCAKFLPSKVLKWLSVFLFHVLPSIVCPIAYFFSAICVSCCLVRLLILYFMCCAMSCF